MAGAFDPNEVSGVSDSEPIPEAQVGAGDAEREWVNPQPEIGYYDFRRPNRISKDRMRTIHAIFDRLVSSLEVFFATQVRAPVRITVGEIAELTFGEYTLSLSKPCAAYTFYLGDSVGCQGVVELGSKLPFFVVDRLFGGAGGNVSEANRQLTTLERDAVRFVAERVMNGFAEVWQDYVNFEPVLQGFEFMPEVLEVASRDDPVMVALFSVESGDNKKWNAEFTVCVPLHGIEQFLALAGGGVSRGLRSRIKAHDEDRKKVEARIRQVSIDLTVRFPEFRLPMRDALSLREGSILHMGIRSETPLEVVSGGKAQFRARPITAGNLVGVSVLGPYDHNVDETLAVWKGRLMSNENKDQAEEGRSGVPIASIDSLSGLMLPVAVEVGRTTMPLAEILKLTRGTVIELERLVGEPFDILVSDKKIAEGEVVTLGEHFGVRITRLFGTDETRTEDV